MDNIIFDKDYTEQSATQQSETGALLMEELKHTQVLENYQAKLDAMPKIVSPQAKARYDELLARLDQFAADHRGAITGVVSYKNWEATITVKLPFLEFSSENRLLLKIASYADYVVIEANADGGVRLKVAIDYFEHLVSREEKIALLQEEVSQDPQVAALLEALYDEQADQ